MKATIAEAPNRQDVLSIMADQEAHPAQRYQVAVRGYTQTVWEGEWSEAMNLDEALHLFAELVRERELNIR